MAHTPRDKTTRSAQERTKKWQPPHSLDAPEPRPGMKHRWVRRMVRNQEDVTNVMSRLRQGYEPVQAPANSAYDKLSEGKYSGMIVSGDLMLMEVPEDIAEQRNEYYDGLADRLQNAVDTELMRNQNQAMPITKDARTETEFGRADREVTFQEDKDK